MDDESEGSCKSVMGKGSNDIDWCLTRYSDILSARNLVRMCGDYNKVWSDR